jgi:peroxiredoxin
MSGVRVDPVGTGRGLLRNLRRQSSSAAPSPRFRVRRVTRGVALLLVLGSAALGIDGWRRNRPLADPAPLRVVEDFSLTDSSGRAHTLADWQGRRAIVLFFLGIECPVSNGYAPEMQRLAARFGPRDVLFLGIHPDAEVSSEAAACHAAEYDLAFPILLDPDQELTRQVGVRVTPEAAVLDGSGQVLYRGRIDDRYGPDGKRCERTSTHELSDAIEAALAGRTPAIEYREAFGCPLPDAESPEPGVPGSNAEPLTWSRHVAPILWNKCAGCHRPGDVAPFSLLGYRDAAKRARFLSDVVESGRMPPWKPVAGFGVFRGCVRLTSRERAILARWADAGASEGDPGELPAPPEFSEGWALGEPDLVLTLTEPFDVPAEGDVYRAFVLPMPLGHDQDVAAVEFRPGNRRVVHHARLYADATGAMRRRDADDPGPGFAALGTATIERPGLGAWIPGAAPALPPPGVGHRLKAGTDVIVEVHYHGSGKPERDRSSVGLYFANTPVTRRMASIPLSTAKIDIAPGDPAYVITQRAVLPANVHAYHILPHGHYLMRQIKFWAELPDGSTRRLLWIDDWDFNWQGQYHFAEPVPLPKGTRLNLVATYDNSSDNPSNPHRPPRRVRYGPSSDDEMLGCHVGILPDGPEDERIVWAKWPYGL